MKKIKLTQGKVALVSDEDYNLVKPFKWYASLESRGTKWYAIRHKVIDGVKCKIRMHRFIMGLPPGKLDPLNRVVDHINHDSLDNRRENLEVITQEENMRRSDGWKKKGIRCKVDPLSGIDF